MRLSHTSRSNQITTHLNHTKQEGGLRLTIVVYLDEGIATSSKWRRKLEEIGIGRYVKTMHAQILTTINFEPHLPKLHMLLQVLDT